MYEIEIASRFENYRVQIGVDVNEIASDFDFAIVDKNVASLVKLDIPTYLVEATENNKTLATVELICAAMSDARLNRKSRVIAIGGGIIQDLATMAASIFMRGVRWTYVPTTLTGMADSCLGGKSSINVGKVKNLVGNIYPPETIFIDTAFLTTLPQVDLTAGLSEAVKICFAHSEEAFETFIGNEASLAPKDDLATQQLIALSLESKKWFIEKDEFDTAERQLLNFGHTFGHALEAATNFQIPHGVGVALGMVAASKHESSHLNQTTEQLIDYCNTVLAPHRELIKQASDTIDWPKFDSAIKSDKKNTREELCLILPAVNFSLEKRLFSMDEGALDVATSLMNHTLIELSRG